MNEIRQISSLQNPLVKKVLLLKEKKSGRNKSGLFVLEGVREMQMALKGNYQLQTVFFCAALIKGSDLSKMLRASNAIPQMVDVSKEVYQRIAYRGKTEGVLAIAATRQHNLNELKFKRANPLILVAEAMEKPGNIGALLRTADAADLDAVIIANPRGDLYNPNVIRSSVGCLFTVAVGMGTNAEVIDYLKKNKISIITADLEATKNYADQNYINACAVVVGTESSGLTSEWINSSDARIIIPMEGEIDSMNVSVSAAILIFEAKRQRALR